MNVLARRFLVFRLVFLAVVYTGASANTPGMSISGKAARQWTIYLAQDKHLDYNWCGSTTEIGNLDKVAGRSGRSTIG